MEIYISTRKEWRKWLSKNYKTINEVWLQFYKKPSGKPRLPYNDAVEEALCFGWIDGKVKRINDDYYIQRFTPRRKDSRWSKYNIERVERLISKGLMRKEGLAAYEELKKRPELAYENRSDGEPEIPEDLMSRLAKNRIALENFLNFSKSYRRMYLDWLSTAKKPETRAKRIDRIFGMAEANLKPGIL